MIRAAVALAALTASSRAFAQALPDAPNAPFPAANGRVRALARSGDTIYVGGNFTMLGGQPRNRLGAFDAATGAVTSWDPDVNAEVRALAIHGGAAYAGGVFTRVNGTSTTRLQAAAFDLAEGDVLAWNPRINDIFGVVTGFAFIGSTVYVSGDFALVNVSVPRNDAAAFDLVVGDVAAWNPNLQGGSTPHAHAIATDGTSIFLGGEFTTVNGSAARNGLAAFNATDGAASAWNPGFVGSNVAIEAMLVNDGQLYVAGIFSTVNGSVTRNNAAAFSLSDAAATSWNPDLGGDALALAGLNSRIYVGGDFTTVNGSTPRNRLAEFDESAGTATAWNPDLDARMFALNASSPTLYAGGDFTMAASTPVERIAGYIAASPTPSFTPTASPTATGTPTSTPTASPTPTATLAPPVIILQPVSQAANVGQEVAFIVAATGAGPLNYQWRKGMAEISNETAALLLLHDVVDGGDAALDYNCVVTGAGGMTVSALASLTVFDPAVPNGADFLSHTAPAQMIAGQSLLVGVAMKNTSALSWSATQGYSLSVTQDADGLFQGATRVAFYDPYLVVPAQTGVAQFVAAIQAPAAPGVYSAQLRMVEEGVEVFGATATITIESVPPPNDALDWDAYQ